MKMPALDSIPSTTNTRTQHAQVRIVLVVLTVFVLGIAAAALTYFVSRQRTSNADDGSKRPLLSESTKSVLRRLNSPVEIRFYSLLDPASVPESLKSFARRVDHLLSEFEREASGKIRLTRSISPSDAGADAASADGIRAFNLEKGDACFLGLAIVRNNEKESIPTLSPEWEQALEFDVIRAIARVIAPKPKTSPLATSLQPDRSAIAEVRRTLPNLDSL
ncbi:MAG: Gldg family protein, partial [Candidatus Diapherotrites archaeon]|nr:Gldg family protein [Candidatus Diapherotrites archaeon]